MKKNSINPKRYMAMGLMSFSIYLAMAATALAQSDTITYQGRLTDGGNPANGSYDIEFRLFDTITVGTGTQIGSTVNLSNVTVTAGIFTTQLQFTSCSSCFNGSDRFLQIAVRPAGGSTFTTLGPRQAISSTPYAIRSKQAATTEGLSVACVSCITGSQFNDGATINLSRSNTTLGESAGLNTTPDINLDSRVGKLNSFFGADAGKANTSGNSNSFFGARAGSANTGGIQNSFFGREAGSANTIGFSNAFFGADAGKANTSGCCNAFFGGGAGFQNTTGAQNSFFGLASGQRNTTGSNNTFIGVGADFDIANPTGNNNTLIGALSRVSSGVNNATAIGYQAQVAQSNSMVLGGITGINGGTSVNVGIGTPAPSERLHVVGNGLFTGNLTVNGTLNAPLPAGSSSYIQNTTSPQPGSNFNISDTGTANIFNALTQYNISGSKVLSAPAPFNLFAGISAGSSNATGGSNSFFGPFSGRHNTDGDANSFFGSAAGEFNTTGDSNSFFGFGAGGGNTDGSFNSFFGKLAGNNNTTGADNSFFGHSAGQSNTIGNNNTFIGAASDGNPGITNATAIGYRAKVAQSNSLVLGSINTVNGATADTNVGIGTTTPSDRLHIKVNGANLLFGSGGCNAPNAAIGFVASFNTCDNYSLLGDGTHTVINRDTGGSIFFREANTTQMIIGPGGNVGINTPVAQDTLHVNGIIRVQTLGTAASSPLCRNSSLQISSCSSSARYKFNVEDFSLGLNLLRRLRPVAFDWKQDGTHDLGLVAEEVAEVEPLLITKNDKGEIEGVKYDRVGVVLINAVKEQQAQIAELREQLRQQISLIADLKKQIKRQTRTTPLHGKRQAN